MRYALPLLLLSALPLSAPAQENEAEKLFGDMEKKITAAKAFQVSVAIETRGDTKDRVGRFRGSLLLTNDNKARLKVSGNDFGEVRNWELISDGKQVRVKPYAPGTTEAFKEEATLATPKKLYGHLAARMSRLGIMDLLNLAVTVMMADGSDDPLELWDFKAGVAEKIGGRDARVVHYQAGRKEL